MNKNEGCGRCHRCLENVIDEVTGLTIPNVMMIVCPYCGNKRCPKATDHEFTCSNSNDPNQPGSIYQYKK